MSLIRYPGSKAKLVDPILREMPESLAAPLFTQPRFHYVEPFFGSGAVGFVVMKELHYKAKVTLSDIDIGIVSLWRAVKDSPSQLNKKILNFTPTPDAFYQFQARDGEYTDDVDTGFRKLALHLMSYSGFGAMSGGPLGGKDQSSQYTVDCRWKPNTRVRHVASFSRQLNRFKDLEIKCCSVFDVLAGIDRDAFAYLDPPYYEKGAQLYKYNFSEADHARLAEVLRTARFNWALSYDDHPRIRELYAWAKATVLKVTYSNARCRTPTRPKNEEILITPQRPVVAASA